MVVYDGEKWRMVRSRNIEGSWKERKDDDGNRIWDGLENIPNYFVTINGRVPKNMSGTGADTFELWPVKHNGNYRFSGRCRYHYDNSKGYYYSVKRYTYWDGRLHSHTRYYTTDQAIDYLEKRMYHTSRHHAEFLEHGKTHSGTTTMHDHSSFPMTGDSSRLAIVFITRSMGESILTIGNLY